MEEEPKPVSVLVVDDQEHYVVGLVGMLIPYGFAVEALRSSDPDQIVQRLMDLAPDVVILDYDLGINHPRGGEEVLEELLGSGYSQPLLVITHSDATITSREMAFKRFEVPPLSIKHAGKFFVDTPGGILELIRVHMAG